MEETNNKRVLIICLVSIAVMIGGVFFWNYISKKQVLSNNSINKQENVDIDDVNNIESVEKKLGEDIKITAGYFLNYTIKKSGVWYMSKGIVDRIENNGSKVIIRIKSDKNSDKYLKGTINKDKCKVKVNDSVYFVGTINLEDSSINLTKISVDAINYKNVTEVNIDELIDNINLVKSNYFIVNGYLVTEGDKYLLYDTKNDYLEANNYGNYFTITWKNEFPYTGTQNVSVKCKIQDTYKLNECELVK